MPNDIPGDFIKFYKNLIKVDIEEAWKLFIELRNPKIRSLHLFLFLILYHALYYRLLLFAWLKYFYFYDEKELQDMGWIIFARIWHLIETIEICQFAHYATGNLIQT